MNSTIKLLLLFSILCVAFSLVGCSGCSSPTEPDPDPEPPVAEWEILMIDPDEGYLVNLDTLSVLVTDTSLVFRMDTHDKWIYPYDPFIGLNAAIFLDTDTNSQTGLSEASAYYYTPNDIGADFAIFVGVEGDALFSWDPGLNQWVNPLELASLSLEADTSRFEAEVHLAALFNPDLIHVVAATESSMAHIPLYDFGPDSGHATIDLGPEIAGIIPHFVSRPVTELRKPPVTAWR